MIKKINIIILIIFSITLSSCISKLNISIAKTNTAGVTIDISKIALDDRQKSLKDNRSEHSATLLANGKVLIHAGYNHGVINFWEILSF